MNNAKLKIIQVTENTLPAYFDFYISNLDGKTLERKKIETFEKQLKEGYKFFLWLDQMVKK